MNFVWKWSYEQTQQNNWKVMYIQEHSYVIIQVCNWIAHRQQANSQKKMYILDSNTVCVCVYIYKNLQNR